MAETEERPKILVIDDDESVRQHLRAMLTHAGFSVICAADGAAGLGALSREEDVALVVLDWMMPVMDGMAVLHELQQQPAAPPALMLTVKGSGTDVKAALDAGAVDFAEKPIQKDVLLFKVSSILQLDRDQAARSAPRRKVVSMPAAASLVVREVSGDGCSLESSFPIPEDEVLFLQSEPMSLRLELPRDHRFALQVVECVGKGNRYRIRAQFKGLSPSLKQRIIEVTRASGWLG